MYSLKDLKLYGLKAITESDISTKDKLTLINDLRKCDMKKTIAFLNKGQMYHGDLTESVSKTIVDEFNLNSDLHESLDNFLFDRFLAEDIGDVLLAEGPVDKILGNLPGDVSSAAREARKKRQEWMAKKRGIERVKNTPQVGDDYGNLPDQSYLTKVKNTPQIGDDYGNLPKDKTMGDKIAGSNVVQSIAKGADTAVTKGKEAVWNLKDASKDALRHARDTGEELGMAAKTIGKKAVQSVAKGADTAMTAGKEAYRNLSPGAQTALKGAGIAALVGLVGMFGLKLYRQFVANSSKRCDKLTGEAKAKCLGQVKAQGANMAASRMSSLKSRCAKAKDPAACRKAVDAKIAAMKAKA